MQVAIPRFEMSSRRTSSSSDKDEFIHKYRRLSEQSDTIRQRLSSFSLPPYDSASPTETYLPTSFSKQSFSYQQAAFSYPAAPAWPQPELTSVHNPSDAEVSDEATLYQINQQIKNTLTELLNCESVKHDKLFRAWVQTKLMDCEHQIKRQRRRRSSVSQETMRTFENSLGGNCASGFGWRSSF